MATSAQYEEGLVYIACPHCSQISRYHTGFLNPSIEYKRRISCNLCDKYFRVVVEAAEPANKGLQSDGGYAPPNGAFDLPHAIDCVRKRYGLPPARR